MPLPTSVPGAVLFVLGELRKYTSEMRPGAQTFAEKFISDFAARNPTLVKPGDEDAPKPPAVLSIDAEIDAAIEDGEL